MPLTGSYGVLCHSKVANLDLTPEISVPIILITSIYLHIPLLYWQKRRHNDWIFVRFHTAWFERLTRMNYAQHISIMNPDNLND